MRLRFLRGASNVCIDDREVGFSRRFGKAVYSYIRKSKRRAGQDRLNNRVVLCFQNLSGWRKISNSQPHFHIRNTSAIKYLYFVSGCKERLAGSIHASIHGHLGAANFEILGF